jgi:hypothetical protein
MVYLQISVEFDSMSSFPAGRKKKRANRWKWLPETYSDLALATMWSVIWGGTSS